MRGVTILPEYAALIRAGYKTWECRASRPPATFMGERIFIHSGKGKLTDQRQVGPDWRMTAYTDGAWCLNHTQHGSDGRLLLVPGAVVATAVLAECLPIVGPLRRPVESCIVRDRASLTLVRMGPRGESVLAREDLSHELDVGWWTVQWYAWHLTDVHTLPVPVEARGKMGWWSWDETGVETARVDGPDR